MSIAAAALDFRLTAQDDLELALARYADAPLRARFIGFDQALWPVAEPGQGWSYFFNTSLLCLGKMTPTGELVAGYLHPWSEVLLITVWKHDGHRARLADAEILMADFILKTGEPPFDTSRYWLADDGYRPVMIGLSAGLHTISFEILFRNNPAASESWRKVIPGLDNPVLLEKNRYGAGAMMTAHLRELVDATACAPADEASAAYRAAMLDLRAKLQAGQVRALLDAATATLPESRKVLETYPPSVWQRLRVVSFLPGPQTCLLMMVRADRPDQYMGIVFRRDGASAKPERIDLFEFHTFYGIMRDRVMSQANAATAK